MTEEQVKNNINEADPLDTPCNDVDTSMPKLQPGRVYRMEIRKSTVGPAKKDPSRQTLTIELRTTEDAVSTDGKPIHKGYPIYDRRSITPSDKMDLGAIAKGIATIVKATDLVNSGVTARQIINDPSMLDGKLVDVKTKIVPESDGFPESTGISQYIAING